MPEMLLGRRPGGRARRTVRARAFGQGVVRQLGEEGHGPRPLGLARGGGPVTSRPGELDRLSSGGFHVVGGALPGPAVRRGLVVRERVERVDSGLKRGIVLARRRW